MSERLPYSIWGKRPWTDSILGPLTPWDTKVGDVICDTCGKILIADIKLGQWVDINSHVEGARRRHIKEMIPKQMWNWEEGGKTEALRLFTDIIFGRKTGADLHAQCTLKWIPEIERKLKQQGVF